MGDGDGWVECRCGRRHWGRHGAVGMVLVGPGGDGPIVLMQHRAAWTHEGGRWGVPGGARDAAESAEAAAAREIAEEAGEVASAAVVVGELLGTDHGDWSYRYVVAATPALVPPVANDESEELRWVPLDEVAALDLLDPLARDWPRLRALIERTQIVQAGIEQTRTPGMRSGPGLPGVVQQLPDELGDGIGLDQEPVVPVGAVDDPQR